MMTSKQAAATLDNTQRKLSNPPNQLSYLNTQRDRSNSSRRELIESSRKILFTNISILEKKREAEVIKGDLLAEAERVRAAKFHFELDTDRYENFVRDQEGEVHRVREAVKAARARRGQLDAEIEGIGEEIGRVKEVTERVDKEQMSPMRRNKEFLDGVA
jgi:predicted RNase H-like nuclease (RuvC/YqgF family)